MSRAVTFIGADGAHAEVSATCGFIVQTGLVAVRDKSVPCLELAWPSERTILWVGDESFALLEAIGRRLARTGPPGVEDHVVFDIPHLVRQILASEF